MSNVLKGALLGAANVVVVALGFAVMEAHPDDVLELFQLVVLFGIAPGLGTGVLLGAIADRLERHRLPVLAGGALAVVVLLGTAFGMHELIALAAIPTVAAASILERVTRPDDAPPLPPARARAA